MSTPSPASRPWNWLLAGVFVLALGALPTLALAQDDEPEDEIELAEEDVACLECHDDPKLSTKLESGETLSLHISTEAFLSSMHNENSCVDCHYEIDIETHGKGEIAVASKRELGVSMADTCQDCHKKKYREYNDSVHALLIEQGSDKAPMCADCHNPHTVRSWELAEPEAAMPCGKCHEDVFKAASDDVHGKATGNKENPAPVCSGCHQAHGVKAASLGTTLRDTCLKCHDDAAAKHKVWLPNAERHFESISCPACHAPTAERRVNLRLFQGTGSDQQQMIEESGVPQFVKLAKEIDKKELGLDGGELRALMKQVAGDGASGKVVLRGRLEVSSAVQAHQLADKSKALADCAMCHQAGAQPFTSVNLTIAGPDGRPLRHDVQNQVLNSLHSLDSVQGFYVLGSTRIKLLDYLLLLAVAGIGGGVLVHAALRALLRRAREKRAREALAAAADPTRQPPSGESGKS